MIDRWYFTHGGQTLGPVTAAQLRQLAMSGRLEPNDLIWPEGRQQGDAVPAHAAIEFKTSSPPLAKKPDWLDDIRAAPATERKPAAPARPDWLEDVRAAEEDEQAFLSLEFDGDKAEDEEEIAKQLLADLDEVDDAEMTEFIPESSQAASCRLVIGSATTRGGVRDLNEDSLLVQQCTWSTGEGQHDVALLVVADGMGGHAAGDRASGLVIRSLGNVLMPLLRPAFTQSSAEASASRAKALEQGLQEANRLVRQIAQENTACKGMGSTAVALLIWDGQAIIRLVGDCRVYHWRGGKLTQVTRDQTLVERMVELGQLSPTEAATHPRRNEVAQAVGKYALLEPGRYEVSLDSGDWLVASSDGLQAHVSDSALAEAIAKTSSSAAELADRLVELANQGGGSDNCTVIAVRCV
ncbi:MAG TPA: GYF domain-containing protein [Gemmataceae bacterium]|nr:GYF domain-containing protein [Gemmataceae bacterium]